MAFRNCIITKHCLYKYISSATTIILISYVFLYLLINIKTYDDYDDDLRIQHDHSELEVNSYYEDVKGLKYPVKVQPNLVRLINASNPKYPLTINAPYLMENPTLCSSVSNLSVLIVFNTAIDHFERRQAIRDTWTNDKFYSHLATVRVLFLLGKTDNPIIQAGIEMEFKKHKDILQGDFIDTYFNLTHKGVMGFKWLSERCRNAEMILKMDDDFMVNMFLYLHKIKYDKTIKAANVYCDYKTEKVGRNKIDKGSTSEYQFRGIESYLRFCYGKFVSMTNDIMPSVYLSSSKTPFYHLDDVLLFGYVLHKIPSLRYQTLQNKEIELNSLKARHCMELKGKKCEIFVIQAPRGVEMKEVWSDIVKHFA